MLRQIFLSLGALTALTACTELADLSTPASPSIANAAPAAPGRTDTAEKRPAADGVIPNYETRLHSARAAEQAGNLDSAYKLYSEALTAITDHDLYAETLLARARVLKNMGRFSAALAAVAPLPENPRSIYDCRKMIFAAEVLQQMGDKDEHVEALYEVALDNRLGGRDALAFRAHGYAALGRLYLERRKTARASGCFSRAEKLYAAAGLDDKAQTCREIREYIQ